MRSTDKKPRPYWLHIVKPKDQMLKSAPTYPYELKSVTAAFPNSRDNLSPSVQDLPDNRTILAAEATAITLSLEYYQHMGPVRHDVANCSDSMRAFEGEVTDNPLYWHIMDSIRVRKDWAHKSVFVGFQAQITLRGNCSSFSKNALPPWHNLMTNVHHTNTYDLVKSIMMCLYMAVICLSWNQH